jgi:eukaryotic-like serine/threonine-protein kinase
MGSLEGRLAETSGVSGVQPGDVLAGKYRVERVLGAGGMGVVVAARHLELDEHVAIKFLLPEALLHPEAKARFAREARAAVRIKSEHVARVSDVGTLENGAPYIVMEYLEGGDLSAWLKQRGPLSIEQAVEFVLQACEAIAEAHGLGIVHRDLKPANLFVIMRADGILSVKVLDFGISKTTGFGAAGGDAGMTKSATVMGSPLYMSPEQLRSARDVDVRTDVWSLGVILYELLTGATPFTGQGIGDLAANVLMTPPTPLRSFRPDVPKGLETVIVRCLEKDRDRRFGNVADMCFALADFAPKRARGSVERIARLVQTAGQASSGMALPASPAPQDDGLGTQASWGQTHSKTAWSGRAWPVGIAMAVLLAAGAGVWLLRTRAGTRAAAPSTSAALVQTALLAPLPSGIDAGAAASVDAPPKPLASTVAATPVRSARPASSRPRPAVAPRPPADDPFAQPH